jgi:uncharacterized protein YchJ
VCENFYDEYQAMRRSIQFFVKCVTNLIKDIYVNNSDEVTQKIRSNQPGTLVEFHRTSHFFLRDSKLIFECADPNLKVEIPFFQIKKDVSRMERLLKYKRSADRFVKKFGTPAFSVDSDTEKNDLFDQIARPISDRRTEHTLIHGQIINSSVKIGRNDPCHCGSGQKFKNCCRQKEPKQE